MTAITLTTPTPPSPAPGECHSLAGNGATLVQSSPSRRVPGASRGRTGLRALARRVTRGRTAVRSALPRLRARVAADDGAVTAEYAILLLAAVAFASLLLAVLSSGEVRELLANIIREALGTGNGTLS